MKKWDVEFTDEAKKDHREFNASVRTQVDKIINRISKNPLPKNEGGYGTPLGNKRGRNLTGYCKVKLLKLGIRVVYRVVRTDDIMKIIVIAARADDEVYDIAVKRAEQE